MRAGSPVRRSMSFRRSLRTWKSPVLHHERIIVTPHLGASTAEAQERVAVDVANQILAILRGEPAQYAVNAPMIAPETMTRARALHPGRREGRVARDAALRGADGEHRDRVPRRHRPHDTSPLKAAAIGAARADQRRKRDDRQREPHRRAPRHEDRRAEGAGGGRVREPHPRTPPHQRGRHRCHRRPSPTTAPHIVAINDFWVDIPPGDGWLLLCENQDRPGMIGARRHVPRRSTTSTSASCASGGRRCAARR